MNIRYSIFCKQVLEFLDSFSSYNESKSSIKEANDLYNWQYLKEAMTFRCHVHLYRSLNRIGSRVEVHKDNLFDAWNNSQVFYFQKLALAFGELFIFNTAIEHLKTNISSNEDLLKIFSELIVLFTLNCLERDFCALRDNDFIGGEIGDVVKEEILKICKNFKCDLIKIIDAISPPDYVLNSPIGKSTGLVHIIIFNYIKKQIGNGKLFQYNCIQSESI